MSRSLVSLVYTKFEQGPFSFIELLVYAVGLLTFTFLLSFRLGSLIRSEAEQGPISLLLSFDWLELCLDQGGGRCLQENLWCSPPASMTSRLVSGTFKMASKVFIEETDGIVLILFSCNLRTKIIASDDIHDSMAQTTWAKCTPGC